jgi:hypothetical protein
LKEVTQRDLSRKFVCFAQNSIGNTTQTIQLKERKEGKSGRLSKNTLLSLERKGGSLKIVMMTAMNILSTFLTHLMPWPKVFLTKTL